MSIELITQLVGFAASVIAFLLFLPQARRTWLERDNPQALAGVSMGTQWLVLCNAVLWAFYAAFTEAFWVGAPGIVNAPLAIATLVLISRARRRMRAEPAGSGCDFCDDEVEHQVFITAPPGWGSVVACSPGTRRHGVAVFERADIQRLRSERLPAAGV